MTDLLATLQELEHLGVGFVSLNEVLLDLTTPAGRAMAALLAVFAAFEWEILQERVRAGSVYARQNSKRLGRPDKRDKGYKVARAASYCELSARLRKVGLNLAKGHAKPVCVRSPRKAPLKRKAGGYEIRTSKLMKAGDRILVSYIVQTGSARGVAMLSATSEAGSPVFTAFSADSQNRDETISAWRRIRR